MSAERQRERPVGLRPSRRRRGPGIRALRKWYGDTRALDGLDLDAGPARSSAIAGPNGAGKSTLIKILAGEAPEDERRDPARGPSLDADGRARTGSPSSTRSRSSSRT